MELLHLIIKRLGKNGSKIIGALFSEDATIFTIHFSICTIDDLTQILEIMSKNAFSSTIGSRDSTIIHSMKILNIKNLISNDKAFSEVNGIRIMDTV